MNLNSQFYLQICIDHMPRLTSASTEMQEQCLTWNDLWLLKTGVSRCILIFCSVYLIDFCTSSLLSVHCISLLLNILNSGVKISDPASFLYIMEFAHSGCVQMYFISCNQILSNILDSYK